VGFRGTPVEDVVNVPQPLPLDTLVRDTYAGHTVLVTGHNGFVGSWLSHWLVGAGAKVVGLSLSKTEGGLADVTGLDELIESHVVDIRDRGAVRSVVDRYEPNFVFHLAAQALVFPSYEDPLATFDTNVIGTGNLLEALRGKPSVRACVVITSDKCYATGHSAHAESDPLGGDDPYSASKAGAEIVTHAYRTSFLANDGIGVATARAGNIVGGGDWAAHRIVPDCMLAAAAGTRLLVRHPEAVRPWQHVLDAAAGYLQLGAALCTDAVEPARAWNFGPDPDASTTVGDLVGSLHRAWATLDGVEPLPPDEPTEPTPHERTLLTLDSSLAHSSLGWTSRLDLSTTVDWTVNWYWSSLRQPGSDLRAKTIHQIEEFSQLSSGILPPVQSVRSRSKGADDESDVTE
jgi:CDP-glucose 4,6-dehydratase